jgi:hypothetical protein
LEICVEVVGRSDEELRKSRVSGAGAPERKSRKVVEGERVEVQMVDQTDHWVLSVVEPQLLLLRPKPIFREVILEEKHPVWCLHNFSKYYCCCCCCY